MTKVDEIRERWKRIAKHDMVIPPDVYVDVHDLFDIIDQLRAALEPIFDENMQEASRVAPGWRRVVLSPSDYEAAAEVWEQTR